MTLWPPEVRERAVNIEKQSHPEGPIPNTGSVHESPPLKYTSEHDQMTFELPVFRGEAANIEKHHLPKIQAIVGDHLDLHPCSSFPSNQTEIDQAADMLQSYPDSPESDARTGFWSDRAPQSSVVEEKGPERLYRPDGSPGFCMVGLRDEKRRRLND